MTPRPTLGLLFISLTICVFGGQGLASAQKPNRSLIQIEVTSVTASNSTLGMDPELKKMPWTKILRSLFAYQSYHMDKRVTQKTVCGRMLTFNLPGGLILHVAPMKIDGHRIDVIIDMFDAERPRMMNMHARLENRATLILGGPHYPPGMMIVMVNVTIVGSPPPQLHLPPPKAPLPRPSPSDKNTVPQLKPMVPSGPGEIAPISSQP
jgi:hypothetical protein